MQMTAQLRTFNQRSDEFLLELSKPLLLLGFIAGTVDVLQRGGIATESWFSLSWSIIQAVAIDGLFIATWSLVFKAERHNRLPLIAIGVILAVVASIVNGILSFQQVNRIADSLLAMHSLHIDAGMFTLVRAVLVVAVAILVSYVSHTRKSEQEQEQEGAQQPETASTAEHHCLDLEVLVDQLDRRYAERIGTMAERITTTVTERISTLQQAQLDAAEEVAQLPSPAKDENEDGHGANTGYSPPFDAQEEPFRGERQSGEFGDAIEAYLRTHPGASITELCTQVGCAQSTASKWKRRVTTPVKEGRKS